MKYELIDESMEYKGHYLRRIRRYDGELGGYIESKNNLSQVGDCWVADKAKVYGRAKVYDEAKISDNAEIYGHAEVTSEVNGDGVVM